MKQRFEGVYPALVTPMTPQGEVDHAKLAELVDYLIGTCGVHGVIPLGSTGEFYTMSPAEREAIVSTTVKAAAGRVPVLAGANGSSTEMVVEYSQQAESVGADGLLLAAPYYSLPTNQELFEHFRVVNDAVTVPIMLYNYPGRTGVDMSPTLVAQLSTLENVRYIKESTGDVTRVSEIIRRCGDKMHVFCGCDCLALESFLLGAIGWVGGIVNVLPHEHVKLYQLAVTQGDFASAREHYYTILPILAYIEHSGQYTQNVKAGCKMLGHDVGPPRRPLMEPSKAELERLHKMLESFIESNQYNKAG